MPEDNPILKNLSIPVFRKLLRAYRTLKKRPNLIENQEEFCIQLRLIEPLFPMRNHYNSEQIAEEFGLIESLIYLAETGIEIMEANAVEYTSSVIASTKLHIKSYNSSKNRITREAAA